MIGRSVSWLIGFSVGQPQPNVVITLVCVVAVCMRQVLVALFLLFSWWLVRVLVGVVCLFDGWSVLVGWSSPNLYSLFGRLVYVCVLGLFACVKYLFTCSFVLVGWFHRLGWAGVGLLVGWALACLFVCWLVCWFVNG